MVKPDNDEQRIAMFKDNKLRLLMTLVGFERLGADDEPDATWIVPSTVTAQQLQDAHDLVDKHRNDPIVQYGDDGSIPAEEMLRRKSATKTRRAEFDDDSEGDGIFSGDEEELFFPAGGPTSRKSEALAELKKKRRNRRVEDSGEDGGLDSETIAARREARLVADLEKRRKIKSREFVTGSDDEDDEERDLEFFAQEEQRRKGQSEKVLKALLAANAEQETGTKSKKRKKMHAESAKNKRARHSESKAQSEDDNMQAVEDSSSPQRSLELDSSDNDASDTPLSSPHGDVSQQSHADKVGEDLSMSTGTVGSKVAALVLDEMLEDEETDLSPPVGSRRRARVAIVDSDED